MSISIHALLAESDGIRHINQTRSKHFYPRSPCGERRHVGMIQRHIGKISIHALLAESDAQSCVVNVRGCISIHALLAESDLCGRHRGDRGSISIHALLAESDALQGNIIDRDADFYPRSPCGERPPSCVLETAVLHYFYPRSPCGERRLQKFIASAARYFYPRSPCGERQVAKRTTDIRPPFLSTLSLRRATWLQLFLYYQDNNFYPRSPCGERRPAW